MEGIYRLLIPTVIGLGISLIYAAYQPALARRIKPVQTTERGQAKGFFRRALLCRLVAL